MTTLFVACAALGAAVLVLQIILALVGLDHPFDADAATEMEEGLELLSVRALSAGVAFFGIAGLAAGRSGIGEFVAVILAVAAGAIALFATALLTRQMAALESDGSIHIDRAVGSPATVYLTVPGKDRGLGKIQVALQGRTIELQAVTAEEKAIPTGASVVVVSVIDSDTVEVLPTSRVEEVIDGTR